MKTKHPHGLDAPGVVTQRVRKVYVGGVREEAKLDGFIAQIGTSLELLGAPAPAGPTKQQYDRAGTAYYLLHPGHPNHWAWWYWRKDSRWLQQLNAPDGDPAVHTGYGVYEAAQLRALKDWHAANPRATAVHPDSVHWDPAWDLLKFDCDPVLLARRKFLDANESVFRAAPGGLHAALEEQYTAFFSEFYVRK